LTFRLRVLMTPEKPLLEAVKEPIVCHCFIPILLSGRAHRGLDECRPDRRRSDRTDKAGMQWRTASRIFVSWRGMVTWPTGVRKLRLAVAGGRSRRSRSAVRHAPSRPRWVCLLADRRECDSGSTWRQSGHRGSPCHRPGAQQRVLCSARKVASNFPRHSAWTIAGLRDVDWLVSGKGWCLAGVGENAAPPHVANADRGTIDGADLDHTASAGRLQPKRLADDHRKSAGCTSAKLQSIVNQTVLAWRRTTCFALVLRKFPILRSSG
jgi:hypothetical protein